MLNNTQPAMINGAPKPSIHGEDPINMPQASELIVCFTCFRPQRQLVMDKKKKR